ncbi:glycosyltransferase family 4 protein [Roseofilum casamattae]|uniref:Glycosyltransferase family 4 protein n=1 Tax=Roseofilum casamattae BLCC-M143 TaxID=3022442 RepID=A0ABT7BWS0_9CYAN|nr:glycosyltransferase family 4 protein [Roseofilum casamattae]MDJ1183639.1 glycosyltransferase family 4 protein [Roseofilum casamattae BLCC-M143]
MKLAFVTYFDLYNPKTWPRPTIGNRGSSYWMAKMLEQRAESFQYIGALQEKHSVFAKLERRFYRSLFPQQDYLYWAEPSVHQNYCRQIVTQLELLEPDVIFSQNLPLLAYLKYPKPKVLWTDTTCGGIPEEYRNACWRSKQHLSTIDRRALQNVDLGIFSSDWAARTAQKLYDINPNKLKVVTTGANIECDRTFTDIERIIQNKPTSPCHLLFMGVNWQRKGGQIAVDIAKMLHELGLPVLLTIVGIKPPIDDPLPDYIQVTGFIEKSTTDGQKQIEELFARSHFLLLPSRSDVTPAVIREASSFGLPSLATNVGGIPTLVRDDRNGKLFELNAKVEEYAEYIQTVFSDRQRYAQLVTSSFQEYSDRLNWQKAGDAAYQLIQTLLRS